MKLVRSGYCLDADPVPSSRSLRAVQNEQLAALRPKPSLMSAAQTEEALAFWRRYTPLEDAGWIDFYLSRTGRFDPRYVPHDLFYAEIDRVLNPPYRAFGLDDKLLYDRLLPDIRHPGGWWRNQVVRCGSMAKPSMRRGRCRSARRSSRCSANSRSCHAGARCAATEHPHTAGRLVRLVAAIR